MKRTRPKRLEPAPDTAAGASPATPIVLRPLEPSDWPLLEDLFGPRGACGGCWCSYWRSPSMRAFRAQVGEPARRALRRRVLGGEAHGVLALEGDRAVGWCALGPRGELPLVETKRAYRTTDIAGVWSVSCFFVRAGHRGRGLASRMLAEAVALARRLGATRLEGYPSVPRGKQPAAFVYKGTLPMFEACGFRVAQRDYAASPLVRIDLARPRSRTR